jgi:hypothetical protein
MQSKMFSLAQYIEDNQDQDFLSLPESLYDNFDDNQFQDNSNQSNPFEPLNQINNPEALNEEQKMSLFWQEEQKESKGYESQINELNKLQKNHANEEMYQKPKEEECKTEKKENKVLSVNKKKRMNFILEGKKKKCRNDYLIKKIKKYSFSIKAKKHLEELIDKCEFQDELKNAKVYLPDHAVFTSETNYRKNQVFLTMTLREIFSLGNKQKNVDLFNMISNSTNYQDQEAYDELINYLDKTGEEIIKEFYGSPEFETFKEENKEGDEAFKQEKKFSFMEKDGFLKLIKNNY